MASVKVELKVNMEGLKGLQDLARQLYLEPEEIRVGVFSQDAARSATAQENNQYAQQRDGSGRFLSKEDRAGRNHTDKISNPDLAAVIEYGSPEHNIPARFFLSDPIRSNQSQYFSMWMKLVGKILEKHVADPLQADTELHKAMSIIGAIAAGDVQRHMAHGFFPPNALATIKAKGSSQPTIDTGQLRQAVSYRVSNNDGGEAGPSSTDDDLAGLAGL